MFGSKNISRKAELRFLFSKQQANSLSGNGEALADGIQLFVGRRFYINLPGFQSKGAGKGFGDSFPMFLQGRFLSDYGSVDIDDLKVFFAQTTIYLSQQFLRIDTLILRVGVGKKVSDIGFSGSAEQGVANCVGKNVSIGVAIGSVGKGEGYSANDTGPTEGHAMNVVTEAGAEGVWVGVLHDLVAGRRV